MKNKKILFIGLGLLGLVMIATSIFFESQLSDNISGIMLGLGSGLVGLTAANFYMMRRRQVSPDLVKQEEIEFKDERNTLIRYRAKALAGDILQWTIMILAFFCILTNQSLWMTLLAVGLFLSYNVWGLYFMWKFQKEM